MSVRILLALTTLILITSLSTLVLVYFTYSIQVNTSDTASESNLPEGNLALGWTLDEGASDNISGIGDILPETGNFPACTKYWTEFQLQWKLLEIVCVRGNLSRMVYIRQTGRCSYDPKPRSCNPICQVDHELERKMYLTDNYQMCMNTYPYPTGVPGETPRIRPTDPVSPTTQKCYYNCITSLQCVSEEGMQVSGSCSSGKICCYIPI